MQTTTKIFTNQTVSDTARGLLDTALIDYLWKLVENRDDNHGDHTFAIGRGELFGMEILQVLHEQNGDERMHKVFGISPVEAVVMVRRRADG